MLTEERLSRVNKMLQDPSSAVLTERDLKHLGVVLRAIDTADQAQALLDKINVLSMLVERIIGDRIDAS